MWEINSEGNPVYVGPDHCTKAGAAALAKRFEDYWAARGVEVRTKLSYMVAPQQARQRTNLVFSIRL
jgi:hypothetical protein